MSGNLNSRVSTKRLIVLCDGTWQNSTGEEIGDYPTNVTRLGRALAREGAVYGGNPNDEENWQAEKGANDEPLKEEQIVFYQKGVGTGVTDRLTGGAFGFGVSAHVREAYSFLASNYEDGDSIFVFGFSRGAYTARSVAAMVARYGLLTPTGMDDFPNFYSNYYKLYATQTSPDVAEEAKFLDPYKTTGRLRQSAANAVKIVGVWDTVGAVQNWLPFSREQNENVNQDLPQRVTYAFQALALDERRRMYQPLLWTQPPLAVSTRPDGLLDTPDKDINDEPNTTPTKKMVQMWFSGAHSDIGGGNADSHLPDISLAWMIAECNKTKLLEFDYKYLLSPRDWSDETWVEVAKSEPWNTRLGATDRDYKPIGPPDSFLKKAWSHFKYWILHLFPKSRIPMQGNHVRDGERKTHEYIHTSVQSRKFHAGLAPPHSSPSLQTNIYRSHNLTGRHELVPVENGETITCWKIDAALAGKGWNLIREYVVDPIEYQYKGRVRNAIAPFDKQGVEERVLSSGDSGISTSNAN